MNKIIKKPYIVIVLILILAVISVKNSGDEPIATVDSNIAEAQAAYLEADGDIDSIGDDNYSWGNPHTLSDHFERHGGDFNAGNAQDYARQAHEFYLNRESFQVKTDEDGVARVYDAETNTFGAYNADGTTRTFYKASGGQAYFDRQPGS